jgi:hypothetical protein
MKLILALMALLLVLACSCSRDERPNKWIFLSKDKDNTYYYTLDKMKKTDDQHLVKVWVKTVFHDIRHIEDDDVSYAKNMFMIKCDVRRYKMNIGFNYSPSNEAVSKTAMEQEVGIPLVIDKSNKEISPPPVMPDPYMPITPGTPAERLYDIVCR